MVASPRDEAGLRIISRDLDVAGKFSNLGYEPEKGGAEGGAYLEPLKIAAEVALSRVSSHPGGTQLEASSDIPPATGLGSSAAIAVSTISAVSRLYGSELSLDAIFNLAFASERFLHGSPSGIDQTLAIHGGTISYCRSIGFKNVKIAKSFDLVIGNTQISRSTGEQVRKVLSLFESQPSRVEALAEQAENISKKAISALSSGDLMALGRLMDENQKLLREVGVSTPKLEELILASKRAGAIGAKLTGAGGGGCMIALITPETQRDVMKAILNAGGSVYPARLEATGLQTERSG